MRGGGGRSSRWGPKGSRSCSSRARREHLAAGLSPVPPVGRTAPRRQPGSRGRATGSTVRRRRGSRSGSTRIEPSSAGGAGGRLGWSDGASGRDRSQTWPWTAKLAAGAHLSRSQLRDADSGSVARATVPVVRSFPVRRLVPAARSTTPFAADPLLGAPCARWSIGGGPARQRVATVGRPRSSDTVVGWSAPGALWRLSHPSENRALASTSSTADRVDEELLVLLLNEPTVLLDGTGVLNEEGEGVSALRSWVRDY